MVLTPQYIEIKGQQKRQSSKTFHSITICKSCFYLTQQLFLGNIPLFISGI